jgi:hypothetical protein
MNFNHLITTALPDHYIVPKKGFGYEAFAKLRDRGIELKRLITTKGGDFGAEDFKEAWENRDLLPEEFKQPIDGRALGLCFMGELLEDERFNNIYPFMYWRDGEWHQDNFYEDGHC